jgi:hypothetical protein
VVLNKNKKRRCVELITENLSTLRIHKLTKEQYDRELAAGRIDENALYLTPDNESDLSAYATQEYVDEALAGKQPIGDYALKSEIPTDYLTEVPSEYVTETELNAKGYLTSYTETDPTVPAWAKAATKPTYTASEVGALPADTVIPTVPTKVSAFINDAGYVTETYVNTTVSNHNTNTSAHNDIRLLIEGLTSRLNTLADSDDTTLDQMSEIVAYIKSNKNLIDGITTNKVNVSDIINNLTTNVANKPLSAAQGVVIKSLIDTLTEELNALEKVVEGKAEASALTSHTENKSNPHGVTASQVGAVPTSRTINGKALSANITLSASDVGADASGAANTALTNAKAYTDAEIAEWVGDTKVSTQISNAIASIDSLPDATTADNGKFLRVVNGAAAWAVVSNAEGVGF